MTDPRFRFLNLTTLVNGLALLLVASIVTACIVEPVGPPRREHWHGWHEWR